MVFVITEAGKLFSLVRLLIILLISFWMLPLAIAAQAPTQWSPRERIPGSHDEANTPYLVSDQNRTVHAFHSQPIGEDESELAIVYNQWTRQQGWTTPIDILLPPYGRQAVVRGASLDRNGTMHLIFFAGEGTAGNIYYSQAPATEAGQARAWSPPQLIGEKAYMSQAAALAGGDQGNLYVVYGGDLEGTGVYVVHSFDAGQTWSDPSVLQLTYNDALFTWDINLYLDKKQQRLHHVWVFNNKQGQGQEIYYASLDIAQMKWDDPLLMVSAEDDQLDQVTDPAVISYSNQLFVFYLQWHTPPFRVMRRSFDGGLTWTDPVKPFETKGQYGWPDFAVDSNNVLHLVLGDRARGLNLWHSTWQDGQWQEPEPIGPLSAAREFQEGPQTFHPWWPRAVVSQGNVLLVTWSQDPGVTQNGSWYTFSVLNAPQLPLVPLPTPPATVTVTPLPTATAVMPTSTPSPGRFVVSAPGGASSGVTNNPAAPFLVGMVPVILILAGIIVVHQLFHHHRH